MLRGLLQLPLLVTTLGHSRASRRHSKVAVALRSLACTDLELAGPHLEQAVKQLRLLLRGQRLSCKAFVKRWCRRLECNLQLRCAVRCYHATDG
jgi:hypothetical protein